MLQPFQHIAALVECMLHGTTVVESDAALPCDRRDLNGRQIETLEMLFYYYWSPLLLTGTHPNVIQSSFSIEGEKVGVQENCCWPINDSSR